MNLSTVQSLIAYHQKQSTSAIDFIETHISWVLLFPDHVYKIKKSVQFSFLDFSTLEKRKHFCNQEVILNNRLTEGVYLGVVAIVKDGKQWKIQPDDGAGEIVDYAVKMKRLDRSREMDILLKKDQVTDQSVLQIADQLANFHAITDSIETPFDLLAFQEKFEDIQKIEPIIQEIWTKQEAQGIEKAISLSQTFLTRYATRLKERHEQGFTVDGHGDLHSGNIFLSEPPVIFDCIEFNPAFRHLDVLDEIGFFCMDLDFYGATQLESIFLERYQKQYPCIFNDADWSIFKYYKWYRANVRLKVTVLKAQQLMEEHNEQEFLRQKQIAENYFQLFNEYQKQI